MQEEILPNDVHEVDTKERKKKKCEIRKRKERRRQITREIFALLVLGLGLGLFCKMQMRPDAGGLMQLGDVTTMSNAARRCCASS